MRRLFLILMIALLPLRGWAAALMSVEMPLQSSLATHQVVHGADRPVERGIDRLAQVKTDCPDHAAMLASPDAKDTGVNSHCSTCVACQTCHSVALTGVPQTEFAPATAASPKPPGGTRFDSAQLASRVKPPIT